jgi:hypothetical protein
MINPKPFFFPGKKRTFWSCTLALRRAIKIDEREERASRKEEREEAREREREKSGCFSPIFSLSLSSAAFWIHTNREHRIFLIIGKRERERDTLTH